MRKNLRLSEIFWVAATSEKGQNLTLLASLGFSTEGVGGSNLARPINNNPPQCPPSFNLVPVGYPVTDLLIATPGNILFREETPKNRDFIETLLLECDIGMIEKLFNKSHRRCYTRLWRLKPRQAESA